MHENNVSYIFLQGFPNLHSFSLLLFFCLLIIFLVTMCANIVIIILVSVIKHLHSPMYFFILVISLLDILMTTDILPNLLLIVLNEGGTISLDACISQLYVFGNLEASECLILLVMSYDRYVAICNPLRYNTIINKIFCVKSIIGSWLLSFLMMSMNAIDTYKLNFCGPNVIDHFFCDLFPVLKLSCSDTSKLRIQGVLICIIVIIVPFKMIIISYVYIITTILNIQSLSRRKKTFSTCSSHLTAVLIFYGSLFSVYMVPTKGQLLATNKVLSLIYTVVTPLLNPFIYSIRNKDFQEAFKKMKHDLNNLHYAQSINNAKATLVF